MSFYLAMDDSRINKMKKLPIAEFEIYSPEKKDKWETLEVALLLFTVSLIALGTLLIYIQGGFN